MFLSHFFSLGRHPVAKLSVALSMCAVSAWAQAQSMTVIRPAELKADRFLDAATLATLSSGAVVDAVRSEAGWVQVKAAGQQGWVRAMALKGAAAEVAAVARVESGRTGNNNAMSTTGIRSVPKASRHALIIGVGEYKVSSVTSLKGVPNDMQSAKQMAMAMSIPEDNISYLRDHQATADQIRQAIQDLNTRVRPGDRVFVYYSGHGTRWVDPKGNPDHCTEGLLSTDGQAITNTEVGELLSPIANKTDKLMVFYDACHSGGIASQPLRTRSMGASAGQLTPKFVGTLSSEACAKPTNMKTRSLSTELGAKGILPENIVSIAASRPDEVSFDDAKSGGLATVAWRDCMLGKAKDMDQSGSVSVAEITRCAQDSLNQKLAQYPDILGQHMTIGGNKDFIPTFQVASAGAVSLPVSAPATAPTVAPTTALSVIPSVPPTQTAVSLVPSEPEPSTQAVQPAQLLAHIHAQRDASRVLTVSAQPSVMRIQQDPLRLNIQSPRSGYLYIALAGSDQKSLYLLFPNSLDGDNYVQANQTIELPRTGWRVTAGGPKGVNTVLVMVADSPRHVAQLAGQKAGPFVKPLLSLEGKSQLNTLLGQSENSDQLVCQQGGRSRNLTVEAVCSDAFASALIRVEEVEAR
ncbi:MAG: DUF4384 domain-containing protein [Betaproteobacteria bacterium]|nr:DUF4384 domain-containing protein [Betaproteobacteria bacterium]